MTTNPNSDAFASETQKGLSKREYFAGLAMQSLASYPDNTPQNAAYWAVVFADNLIKELNTEHITL